MDRSGRRWVLAMVAATAVLVSASMAWACVGVVALTTSSSAVQPGGTVTVFGKEFAGGSPVQIHLDSPTGPVLATADVPAGDTMTSKFSVPVAIPANTPYGQHFLVATQQYHDMNAGAPARAVLNVGTEARAVVPPARAVRATVGPGPSAAKLVLIGAATAGVALLLAGLFIVGAGRKRTATPTVAAA